MQSQSQRIGKFFSHPYMIAIAWAATVIALPLSIYLYVASDHKPRLKYEVHSVNASVVRAGQSSKLSISYDGKPLTEDVTSAQIAIWNAGELAIHEPRQALSIFTDPKARILEARVRRASRDVIGLKVDDSEIAQ